jgi:hypothetical protein
MPTLVLWQIWWTLLLRMQPVQQLALHQQQKELQAGCCLRALLATVRQRQTTLAAAKAMYRTRLH